MVQRVAIDALRPTQLYLSAEKLAAVLEWFDPESESYDPLPIFEYEEEWYLADGHTRAFVAWLAGAESFRVELDASIRTDYDFDLYRTCIGWCAEAGVRTVPDLAGRVLGHDAYEAKWIERCHEAATDQH